MQWLETKIKFAEIAVKNLWNHIVNLFRVDFSYLEPLCSLLYWATTTATLPTTDKFPPDHVPDFT